MRVFFLIVVLSLISNVRSEAQKLEGANFNIIVSNSKLVLINFYAEWCRFSSMLSPIWNELADKVKKDFKEDQVHVAKVDAEAQKDIAILNKINKYPTIKMYRYGVPVNKEYRGARTVDALHKFLVDEMKSKLKVVKTSFDLMSIEEKPTLVGYFKSSDDTGFNVFEKLANIMRDKCLFVAAVGNEFNDKLAKGDHIVYNGKGANKAEGHAEYSGQLTNYEELYAWAFEICTPTVQIITFENAEELTEGGVPFLILFHKPNDKQAIETFEKEIKRQLVHQREAVLPVAADGSVFSHPLHHLGKTDADLPVVAIDSFKHMYVFPDGKKYNEGLNLQEFVKDLQSDKLHREYHEKEAKNMQAFGPAIVMLPNGQFQIILNPGANHIPRLPEAKKQPEVKKIGGGSIPPESAFVKLAPSEDRYSQIRHGDGGEF